MDGRTYESPPVFYRTSSPLGPLPKKVKCDEGPTNQQTKKAGCIVVWHATKYLVERLFSHVLRDSTPRCVGRLVGRSVGPFFTFLAFFSFCPNTKVTFSSPAPAHPHGAGVAVYSAFTVWPNGSYSEKMPWHSGPYWVVVLTLPITSSP